MSVAIGFLILMLCLLTAVHVLTVLYARSVVTTAAYEAARHVATHPATDTSAGEAKARTLTKLQLTFSGWNTGPDVVRVRVHARAPGFSFGLDALRDVDVTVQVRKERFAGAGAG